MKTAFKCASDLPRSFARSLVLLGLLGWPAFASAESLWTNGNERSLIADRKAARTGDIVTVVVAESAAASNSQNKKTSRESALEDAVQRFLFSAAASTMGTHKGELPAVNIMGKSSSAGGGEVSNNQSLTSRAAVLVTDVLPNGNLVIQGVRVVTFSGETQYVVLHGLVRPDDVSPSNTVLSSNIADARVEFVAEGSLTDAQKRGWLAKVYEKLRPF